LSDSSANGTNLGSGTVAGLLSFLDWVVKKNYATPASITPLKSAARQVFVTVEGDGEIDNVDVRELDREEYFSRFQVAMQASGRLTPESVRAYRNRFTRALDLYEVYLNTGDVPKLRSRSAAAVRVRKDKPTPIASPTPGPAASEAVPETPATNLISYPFPLESGEIATLRLPKRLERRDAERLTAFIEALIFEPQKQIGPGRDAERPAGEV
jgi:hypothetical protein